MLVRSVVKTKTGDVLFGAFAELNAEQVVSAEEFMQHIKEMNYLSITTDEGDTVIINPDDISYIKLERSRQA